MRSTRPGQPTRAAAYRCGSPPTASPSSGSQKQPSRAGYIPKVTLYHADGCHLCERAREVLVDARTEVPFELEEIDIGGDEELEAKHREWLPVVEIDGERAFVYFVDRSALLRKLTASSAPDPKAGG